MNMNNVYFIDLVANTESMICASFWISFHSEPSLSIFSTKLFSTCVLGLAEDRKEFFVGLIIKKMFYMSIPGSYIEKTKFTVVHFKDAAKKTRTSPSFDPTPQKLVYLP